MYLAKVDSVHASIVMGAVKDMANGQSTQNEPNPTPKIENLDTNLNILFQMTNR